MSSTEIPLTTAVHTDMPDEEYFKLQAVSHSDTKLLHVSPAHYRGAKDHPGDSEPTDDMRFGTAVHSMLLGGPEIVRVPFDSWTLKDAKQARSEALEAGALPLKQRDYDQAKACVDAVMAHPLCAKMLDKATHHEAVLIWDDDGVQRRAKIDALFGRIGLDVKTARSAAPDEFSRSCAKFGYWTQDPYYRDALRACLDIDRPEFLFLVVEKQPPHLVNVIKLDDYDVELGAKKNQRAIDLYRRCRDADEWPGYGDGINEITLPKWAEIEEEMQ